MRANEFTESHNSKHVLDYVKSIHDDFHLDDEILKHPQWQLTAVPLSSLHVPDPESGIDTQDPYDRVQYIDMYHVDDITAADIKRNPIVVDDNGHILDGNHRAVAARSMGMRTIPAWVPVSDMTEDTIKLGKGSTQAQKFIDDVYSLYPHTWQNNHVMVWGEGDDQELAMFELVPNPDRANTVEVKWFQAYPLRRGIGSRAMRELQRLAKESGINLSLFVWDKGQVSAAQLTKFYRAMGFRPTAKGSRSMTWSPVSESVPRLHFVRPGELRGSYSNQQLRDMGFKRAQNGSWYISQALWDQLVQSGQLREDLDENFADASIGITEYRDRMYQYIKSIVPSWPDYIVKDWLYANFARGPTQTANWSFHTIGKDIPKMLADMGLAVNTKWQLIPNMKFTMDMWEPKTLKRLKARAGGNSSSSDPEVHIPAKDAERHATQAALAKQQGGIRKEPVILIKTAQGYELVEGWHRTIQHFARYPQGYTGPAYVAMAQTVAENFADGKKPGRKGLSKRMGVPTKASVSKLRKIARSSSGEKQRMAHWLANMKAGRKGSLSESSYPGNVGMMELVKFFKVADHTEKQLLRDLLQKGKNGPAWQLIQDVTGTKLQGQEYQLKKDISERLARFKSSFGSNNKNIDK
jgi:GNAT superfamily N-acetyltransferase